LRERAVALRGDSDKRLVLALKALELETEADAQDREDIYGKIDRTNRAVRDSQSLIAQADKLLAKR
jgi:hypothetical protein